MKSLVLAVTLLCLLAVLQAQDDLPFLSEDRNISGIWYQMAIVNDLNITRQRPIEMQNFPFEVRALEKENLEVTFTSMYYGDCVEIKIPMKKTEKPGLYTAFWNTLHTYIYELPVKDHYVFINEYSLIDRKFREGELIGKDPKKNLQALEEFKKFTQSKGFPPENIIVPEQREVCVPEVLNEERGASTSIPPPGTAAPQICKSPANSVSKA